jgi:hypothetical protein
LVEGVLQAAPRAPVIACEVDPRASDELKARFGACPNVRVVVGDVLQDLRPALFERNPRITRVIANPPYGAWQNRERRRELKARFPGLYVKESYAVFLFVALSRLAPGGRLVFIVSDTFLWLHRHEFLRRTLFTNTCVEEIAFFPSSFFPGIHFGYSGLCIITLRKEVPSASHMIRLLSDLESLSVLSALASNGAQQGSCRENWVGQREVIQGPHCALVLRDRIDFPASLTWDGQFLGDAASIVTGFYSGNDRRWLRRASDNVRRADQYQPVAPRLIAHFDHRSVPPLDGIRGERCFIPIVRGGAAAFVKPTVWYVDWSDAAVLEYKRSGDNAARFQNSRFYFRQGVAVPMVASSKLSAALLDYRLFDQGIVGVFPHDERLLKYLLAFLNTRFATELLRAINPTANNSANYLKRLPFVYPGEGELQVVTDMADRAVSAAAEGTLPPDLLNSIESAIRSIWERKHTSANLHESVARIRQIAPRKPGGMGLAECSGTFSFPPDSV